MEDGSAFSQECVVTSREEAMAATRDGDEALGLMSFAGFSPYLKVKTSSSRHLFHVRSCQSGSTNGTSGTVQISSSMEASPAMV